MDFFIPASISVIFMVVIEVMVFNVVKSAYELHNEFVKGHEAIIRSLREMTNDEKKQ